MEVAWHNTEFRVWVVPGIQLGEQSYSEFLAFCPLTLLVLFDHPPVAFPWGHVTTHWNLVPVL